ncbi:MAG TPA: FecR domain-containing protein [Rhizomicrobium sp.]
MHDHEKIVKFPDVSTVEAEAAEWIVRLDAGGPAEDYARFLEWQNRSPLHREAALRLTALWSQFDALKEFAAPFPGAGERRQTWTRRLWNAGSEASWRKVASAAALLVLLAGAGLFYTHKQPAPLVAIPYETALGSQKDISLPDGSTVVLNTNSRLDVVYSKTRRDVYLHRGEAFFEIASSDKRPFTVHANAKQIHDIGTAFDVRLLRNAVEVTVTKGAVELVNAARPDAPSKDKVERLGVVSAGQNAVFSRKLEYVKPLTDAEINRHLAWREGILVYAGEPLARVVEDVSRYTNIRIELGDPKLRDIQVGGYFEISKIGSAFEALEKNFGIQARWRDTRHVRLYLANDPAAHRPLSSRSGDK